MIFFVLIGIILLRYMYVQVVVPPDVQRVWDKATKEYERELKKSRSLAHKDIIDSDLDLIENDIIDL